MTVTVTSGHVLTFEANTTDNVSNMPETQPITFKELPAWNVTRSGYTFVGWNTEPDGDGTSYRSGDEFPTNADITLYAQWVRDSFLSYSWDGELENSQTTISSVDDWNDLATAVNNGYLHGKTITLVNDIGDENNPIRRCIGTRQYPFDNHFNGNGHTIYVNINDTIHEGTAPFRCVGKCPKWHDDSFRNSYKWMTWRGDWAWNIYRLKVKGTVRGGKYCSGLVGISRRVELFLCAVQTDVITTSTHCAGVIGYIDTGLYWFYNYSGRVVIFENDTTSILSTVFSGSISGATQSTGIFIGDHRSNGESTCDYCLSTGTVSGANIDFAPPSEVTHSFKTTNHGNQGSYIPYDPAAIVREMVGLIIDDRRYRWCVDDDGSILPFHQVYIDTAADWDKIATRIAGGASFKDRELVLNSDITVGTMLGTEEHPFDGTFDGQNHTLTFNLTTDESGCAPFRYIKDASIHDLKIDGTLEHSVGAKTRLAGVAAYTSGNNNRMENITVSSTIRSQASSFHHAGLVAQINDGRVIFLNCAFKGKLLCDANSSGCGGLVAVNMGSGTSFYNCLFAPTECTVGTDNSSTISRDIKQPSIIINTCYTRELGELQGSRAYTVATAPDNVFCSLWTGPDSVDYYQPVPTYIGGLQHTYNYNDGNPIDIDYTFYCRPNLLDAEKYTATITKNTEGTEATEVTEVTDIGSYTLFITANDSSGYHGTVERPFYVTASSLSMNDQGHFLINSADDWNTLCELSGDAHQAEYQYFEGRVVELTADIIVNQQVPIFCGILEGNGHTVTFNYGTAQNPVTADCAAPIYNLRGNAVVENLHVAGTIVTSTGRFTAGLVGSVGSEGSAQHNVRITGCRSSIRIKTTYNGQCYNGGFVGFARNGKLALNNCLFDGCFTSENNTATHWAGFVGYKGDAAVSINSCLYFANRHEMRVPSEDNATFCLPTDATNVTVQNCCYTVQNWGEDQQGTYVANNLEAGPQMAALGYDGWYIVFGYPQWQDYYQEGEVWPLVLPRYDYHTAMAGHINGLQGSGIDGDPYLIGSTADWNLFAASINNNNVGTDAFYQLTDDITIDQGHLVGTTVPYTTVNVEYGERRSFRGTFDGNGHTLTLNMSTNGDCAPFLYAQDCTVKNLTIGGTISTSGQRAAGLIANAAGTVNITGCRSNLTINSSYNGESSYAGLVAKCTGITNIEGCVFDGNISGTTFCIGNCNITNSFYTKPTQTGQGTALYSVTAAEGIDMSIGGDGVLREYGNGIAIKGDGLLLDGVFYAPAGAQVPIETLELITGYSPQDATIAPSAGTYANGTLTMPAQNVVFGTSSPIALSTYTIHFDANGGTGDAMADMNLTYGDGPLPLTTNSYILTAHSFTGWNTEADGSGTAYTNGQTVENLTTVSGSTITLYAQWEPWIIEGFGKTDSYTPDGTAEHPYIISNAEEWNLLCDYISSGKGDLASCHYRLGNNFTVSRMMGTEANPFRGTFEGQQCTLTLDLTGEDPVETESIVPTESENTENTENQEEPESMDYPADQQSPQTIETPNDPNTQAEAPEDNGLHALAPFAYVNGATIKNLRTTGTISGESSYFAGGIVGKADGNTTLQSCYSNVAITSTATVAEGDEESPMLGGIVAQSTGTLSFTDCLFDGTINAENTSYCGGFLGQRVSGTVTFTNCLMDGELNCDLNGCGTYYKPDENTSGYTFTNSYYHTAYGAGQGTQTDDTGETLKAHLGESWAVTANEAVVPFINPFDLGNGKLSLSAPAYPYTGSAISVSHTLKNIYDEVLAENTHYTVTIKNAEGTELTEVTELGEYILTVNGKGNYMGSKRIYFYVYESDGTPFPLETDDDFDSCEDGYFYVRMPRSGGDWDDYGDLTDTSHDAEDNPRIVNIPAGITRKFMVYDDGGKKRWGDNGWGDVTEYGYYKYGDEPKTLTLTCPEGYSFSVQGPMIVSDEHYFSIYDGSSVAEGTPLLDHANGHRNIGPIVTSGNSITFWLDPTEWWGLDVDGFDLTAQVIPQVPPTTLANDDSQLDWSEKNTIVIAANNGEQINVTLNGRTLYKDGTWNTLCLPFDIANIGSTPLRGAIVKALNSTSYSDGTLTLNFSHNLTSLEAGQPYIVKWDASATPVHYTATDGTYDEDDYDSQYGFANLVDNDNSTYWEKWEKAEASGGDSFCEFVASTPVDVTGYTLIWWLYNDPPTKWTLKGKRNPDDEWTLLDSRDITLPETGDEYGYGEMTYEVATSGTYRYFRFDVLSDHFSLSELKLVGTPILEDIVNPTFINVTIKDELHPVESGGFSFGGNYSTLASTDGLLLDAHNAGGNAFHATLSLPDVTLFTDAGRTTPVTGAAIPFAADGSVTFYYSQSDLALTLHDDDSQAADGEKNADLIAAKDGEFAIVTLDGRTLYKDGTWNTICLPFDIADVNRSPLRGAYVKAFALERAENNDGVLTLNFSDVGGDLQSVGGDLQSPTIEAGKPYIVKWDHVDFPAFAPSEHLLNSLGFIDETPVVDDPGGSREGGLLVDGNVDSQWHGYGSDTWTYCAGFHYEEPITPTGYALWTADEGDGDYNPTQWTIYAKNEGDVDWTVLVTVDNSAGKQLPMANSTCTLFELNTTTAYQYFLFEAIGDGGNEWDYYQLSELKFFTGHPNTDIVNPVFSGVTIKNQATATDNYFFEGSYSKLASTDGQMLDAHNEGGKAFHATLSLSSLNSGCYDFNCYADAEHTTPVGGTIPFNASDGSVTLYPKWALTLNNNDSQAAEGEKNADIIIEAAVAPTLCDVTLAGRTLYKDGEWNTLCLPFNLGDPQAGEGHYFDGTLLEGATVMTLKSTEFEDGTLTMTFDNMPMVVAGVPFIVKWEGDGSNNLVAPVFEGVTISNSVVNLETTYVDIIGTYNYMGFNAEDKSILFLGQQNTLYYPQAGASIGACRAYFQLKGITAGQVNSTRMFFGDDETGISDAERLNDKGQMINDNWYTLDGRKLDGRPTKKGLYIHGGRTVVIK